MATKVEGLARLRAKVLQRFPAAVKADMKAANRKNAEEFAATVRRIIPKGDPKDGQLVETLQISDAEGSETGVEVTIGGPSAPHPLHLEAGHRNRDGSHTAAKPFWNPAKRTMSKKAKGRANRVANKAIKGLTTPT